MQSAYNSLTGYYIRGKPEAMEAKSKWVEVVEDACLLLYIPIVSR